MGGGAATQEKGQSQKEREREAQAAVLAVVASQTLFKKLGNAFWDAFSGSSSPSSSSSSSPSSSSSSSSLPSTSRRNWDADKVRKVLEGKAVVRVVDVVDTLPSPPPPPPSTTTTTMMMNGVGCCESAKKKCEDVKCSVGEILEESMRSLTLGKGNSGGGGAKRT